MWLGLLLFYRGSLPITKNRRSKKAHDHMQIHGHTKFVTEEPHVNHPQTGSSSVQHSLSRSRSRLSFYGEDGEDDRKYGVMHSKWPSESTLALNARPDHIALSLGKEETARTGKKKVKVAPTKQEKPVRRPGFKGTIMYLCFDTDLTKNVFNGIFFLFVMPGIGIVIWSVATASEVRKRHMRSC